MVWCPEGEEMGTFIFKSGGSRSFGRSSNDSGHLHECKDCKEKLDFAHLFHTFVSDWIFALTVSWKMCYTISYNEQRRRILQ